MISRSIGGAYDYECISIFIIVLCIYSFALALKTGSIFLSVLSALAYAYLALSWGD
jgi:dolichyl-diphosphooligosaccharide--protein glycosyltransferase